MTKTDDDWVRVPRKLTPAIACALAGAMPPPFPNGDPHGAIPQYVEDWRERWARVLAVAEAES